MMGFSSSLQGSSSHDAILMRIDAELRLLENMRRCLSLRIKADREYAIGLNSFVLQAQKMDSVELNGSHVAKAWTVFIDETDKMVKYIKENAEFLASNTIDKINALYAEKKANRKQHQEEYSRIFLELNRLQDTTHKTRNDYERCVDNYVVAKAKYEEQYGKGKIGRRLDDCRDRYQKACRKLHQTHNEYVLLISEAAEFERDMRTILLPGLLEYQQAVQEDMIDKWKLILQDIRKYCPYSSAKFSELQAKVDGSVTAVKAADEYAKFIDQNRTSPPAPVVFKFDETLLEAGKIGLNPSSVTLDDLTIDTLKQRLQENESRLSECRNSIKEKQTSIIQYETELATVKIKSDPVSVTKMFNVKKLMDGLKKEVNELRCVEQKLTKQIEMIQAPLSELGCEQAPPGCDVGTMEVLIENTNVEVKAAARRTTNPHNPNSGSSAPAVMNILKKPFSNVGATNSLNNSKKLGGSGNSFVGLNNSGGSRSSPNLENQSVGLSENNSSGTLVEGSTPTEKRKVTEMMDDTIDSSEGSPEWEDPNATLVLESGRPLEDELWFHGVLPRGEVVRLLVKDGDFLVRETTRNDEKQIVLSVMWGAPKHFIVQTSPEGLFRFEGPAFDTVQELILHQFQSSLPVTSRSGAILKTAVVREKWELNNDAVELVDKIGRGNFGDVYRANLHQKGHPRIHVAVKTCKVTLPEEQKKKFLQEGRILKQYDHPNIVKFIGICVQKQPIMIVMELVAGGSLLNFLRNNGANLTTRSLLGMCLDASAGMQYLEMKNCIHRDLAARNCLVGENNVVKISDFGMSREEEEYTVSDGLKQIPIKWTAPEALNYGKYTSLCDVWSFGVLCWEIFSKGGTPYQGMTNTRAREMLDSGYRMPAPEGTPDEMYKLMLRCWQYEPEDRPHFPEIHSTIDLLYSRYTVSPETRV